MEKKSLEERKRLCENFLNDIDEFGNVIYSATFHCDKNFDLLRLERLYQHGGIKESYYFFETFAINEGSGILYHLTMRSQEYILSDASHLIKEMIMDGVISSYNIQKSSD